jgi:GST-like protein
MINLYSWITPNGFKISIMLEELGVPFTCHSIDITKGEQFSEAYGKISPTNKIPAIFDRETSTTVIESSAILLYLADKYRRFISADGKPRLEVIEWLMWQTGSLGPTLGHAHNFLTYNEGRAPYAEDIFRSDVKRLYETLDARLQDREFVAGDYSIADIAIWPWISRYERHKTDLNTYPNVLRWCLAIAARPAVQRGYRLPHFTGEIPLPEVTHFP